MILAWTDVWEMSRFATNDEEERDISRLHEGMSHTGWRRLGYYPIQDCLVQHQAAWACEQTAPGATSLPLLFAT